MSDIVYINEATFIADTHVSIGLVCGDGGAVFWPLLMGLLQVQGVPAHRRSDPGGQGGRTRSRQHVRSPPTN